MKINCYSTCHRDTEPSTSNLLGHDSARRTNLHFFSRKRSLLKPGRVPTGFRRCYNFFWILPWRIGITLKLYSKPVHIKTNQRSTAGRSTLSYFHVRVERACPFRAFGSNCRALLALLAAQTQTGAAHWRAPGPAPAPSQPPMFPTAALGVTPIASMEPPPRVPPHFRPPSLAAITAPARPSQSQLQAPLPATPDRAPPPWWRCTPQPAALLPAARSTAGFAPAAPRPRVADSIEKTGTGAAAAAATVGAARQWPFHAQAMGALLAGPMPGMCRHHCKGRRRRRRRRRISVAASAACASGAVGARAAALA